MKDSPFHSLYTQKKQLHGNQTPPVTFFNARELNSMKTAILFKTHIWNNIVEKNFLLCKKNSHSSDIFIVIDSETGDIIPRNYQLEERIFLAPYSRIDDIGLEYGMDEKRSGYWYNGDYHQNLFILSHPGYDYICTIENDVAVHAPLDDIFLKMNRNNLDVIYHPQTQVNSQWSHLEGSVGYTDIEKYVHKGLFCISFFSQKAAFYILRRRLEMSHLKRKKNLSTWPIGESVMIHEPLQAGMNVDSLINYCDHLDMYDWAPCYLECEEQNTKGKTFIHPVTNIDGKFINSNFYQDYHSLFSEKEVIEGISRKRAKVIKDLEIYSRLFNSVHVRWSKDRWEPILQDAEQVLDNRSKRIIGGKNYLSHHNINIQTNRNVEQISDIFTSTLPNWDNQNAILIQPNEIINISLESNNKSLTAIIGTEQPEALDNISAFLPDRTPLNISCEGNWRKMFFFSFNIPFGEKIFHVKSINNNLLLHSMRVIDNPIGL